MNESFLVKACGLYGDYCNDLDVRRAIPVAFLPVELVPRTFRALADRLQDSGFLQSYPNMEQVYLYLNDELGRPPCQRHFLAGWNQFNSIIDQLPNPTLPLKAVIVLGKTFCYWYQ